MMSILITVVRTERVLEALPQTFPDR
jgi:hypothetical protein